MSSTPIIRSSDSTSGNVDGNGRKDLTLNGTVTLSDLVSANIGVPHSWALTKKPPTSTASLTTPSSATSTFSPDQAGSYQVECTVAGLKATVVIAVALPTTGARQPALGEELEYDATYGWWKDLHGFMGTVDTLLGATTISYGGAPPAIATSSAAGTNSTASRSDHTHAHGDHAGGTLHAVANGTTAGFMSASDKTKLDGLPSSIPFIPSAGSGIQSTDDHNSDGTSTAYARVDHVHDGGVLSFAIATGSGGNASVGGSSPNPQLNVWPLNLTSIGDSDISVGTSSTVYNFTSFSANRAASLPDVSTVTNRTYYLFKDSSANTGHTLSLTPFGSDTIDGVAGSVTMNTGVGESRMLMRVSGGWIVMAASKPAGASYTFTSGLSGTTTITNDLITGKAGGQTVTFGVNSGDGGILTSTTNATKGAIQIGATSLVTFTENLTKASGTSATLDLINFPANTVTVTGSTAINTSGGFNYLTIAAPTFTDSSSVTVTHATTVAIKGPPVVGGSLTATNLYPLWVQAGNVRMDGTLTVGGNTPQSGFILYVQPQTGALTKAQVKGFGSSSGNDTQLLITNAGNQANAVLFANNHFTTGTLAGINKADMSGLTNVGADAGTFVVGTMSTQDFVLMVNSTEVARLTNANKNLLIGTTTDVASTQLRIGASKTVASATGAVWDGVDFIASTLTLSGSTAVTTSTGVNSYVFRAPTLSAASALTVTRAATVRIDGAPTAAGAGPATITDSTALIVAASNSSSTYSTSIHNLVLENPSGGQTWLGVTFAGSVAAGWRFDSAGNVNYHATGSQGHVFYAGTLASPTTTAQFTNNNNYILGTTTDVASTRLRINTAKTVASGASAVWDGIDGMTATLTLSGSTNITTATGVNMAVFRAPTITAGSALTVTSAATVAIGGPPAAAGSASITNAMSLWVQGGTSRFDGALALKNLGADLTSVPVGADGVVWMFGGQFKAMGASGVPVILAS